MNNKLYNLDQQYLFCWDVIIRMFIYEKPDLYASEALRDFGIPPINKPFIPTQEKLRSDVQELIDKTEMFSEFPEVETRYKKVLTNLLEGKITVKDTIIYFENEREALDSIIDEMSKSGNN